MNPSPSPAPRNGGRILIDSLRRHGVDRIYSVPGESFLAALDALHDTPEIQIVVCRHEGAAANMAEADGKLTGRPGICFVTRGPGATHASVGVHTAFQDSTPMLLLIGQVPRLFSGREAFQEIDLPRFFGPIAKAAAQIERARSIPLIIARAFRTATSGRKGPVVLSLPEDILSGKATPAETVFVARAKPRAPSARAIRGVRQLLEGARRPLVIVGGSGWTQAARRDLAAFVKSNALPVAASFRRQDRFDNGHPNYVGNLGPAVNPKLAEMVKTSDLLIAIGTRLGELTTSGYTLLRAPTPHAKLIHIHAGAGELGRVYRPALAIVADLPDVSRALRSLPPIARPTWLARTRQARGVFEAFSRPDVTRAQKFSLSQIMAEVEPRLPADAIVTNGAGNFAIWVHRFHRYRRLHGQLAPTSGAMGYGVPAAIAAKLRHPGRPVICFAGDGDFMMYPQELITAVRYRLAIIFIVVDNGMYGTIRMHQERAYPGRPSGTDLLNPDFAAFARSFGMPAATVETAQSFRGAFGRALRESAPTLIHAKVDPAQLTPDRRLA